MKAIIFAAGRGTRISKYIGDIPKCLVPITSGQTLLSHTIRTLRSCGIDDIGVIVGYKKQLIEEELKNFDNISIFYNPFYAVTNSLGSLFFAKNILKHDDIIFLNGDVFFEKDILNMLLKSESEMTMLSDLSTIKNGDYFLKLSPKNEIVAYGKDLPLKERTCEYVGLAKVKSTCLNQFVTKLDEMIDDAQYNQWWENVCYEISKEKPVYALDVKGKFWAEADYIEDYERIKKYCSISQ